MSEKISALAALTAVQQDDVLPIVDVHDTTMAASGTTKKVSAASLALGTVGVANVRAYGAKGDGSTDDTAAFGSARDAAGTAGTVLVPPGTYVLSALALSTASQRWVIMPGSTLLLKAAANGPLLTVSAAGVTVTGGGVIDGNYANQTPGFHPLAVATTTDITFDGVTVQNANGYGISFGGSGQDVSGATVRNCTFKNTYYDAVSIGDTSLAQDISRIAVSGNKIYNYNSALIGGGLGISVIGNTTTPHFAREVTITGNRIECWPIGYTEPGYGDWSGGVHLSCCSNWTVAGNAIYGTTLGITVPDCQNGTITGNSVEGYAAYAIEVPAPNRGTKGTTVTGNTIEDTNPRSGTYPSLYAISISATGSNVNSFVTVVGNNIHQITAAGYPSIGVGGSGMSVTHVVISANVINKSAGGSGAIQAQQITDLKISDNVIDCGGTTQNVIWLNPNTTAVEGWSVTGNEIANFGTGTAILYGNGTQNMDYVVIANNLFRNGGAGAGVAAAGAGTLQAHTSNTGNVGP